MDPIEVNYAGVRNANPPKYATAGSAGCDLIVRMERERVLHPGDRHMFFTGIRVEIPPGFFGMVCSRSGLAHKHGIIVLNAPGIIDSDYVGEIKLLLYNAGHLPQRIVPGYKAAQLIFVPHVQAKFKITNKLTPTDRGENGFGSTGETEPIAIASKEYHDPVAGDCPASLAPKMWCNPWNVLTHPRQ